MSNTSIFRAFARQAVACPKCRINKPYQCINLTRKHGYVEEDGKRVYRYKPLKDTAIHEERMKAWERLLDEQKQREKEDGLTRKQRLELEELRKALAEAQEVEA